jgi:hypothetical protein
MPELQSGDIRRPCGPIIDELATAVTLSGSSYLNFAVLSWLFFWTETSKPSELLLMRLSNSRWYGYPHKLSEVEKGDAQSL